MSRNDNRNYKFSLESESNREEYSLIAKWVKDNSKVIDLGCGDGSLLKMLQNLKRAKAEGIEISQSGVESCLNKGVKAKQGRIDEELSYKDNQFDTAICNVTIQMVEYPEVLLSEMIRISKNQIVTFPNFAFVLNRLDMLLRGRMPKVMIPGYEWYSTGHVHQLSINDFKEFCVENNINIIDAQHIFPRQIYFLKDTFMKPFPNLFASTAVFFLGEI